MEKKLDIKKVFICGGTGFLGFYSAKEFLRQGVEVSVLALPNEITLNQSWWPKEIKVNYGMLFNLRKMHADENCLTKEQLVEYFKGYDVLVYAVGPDDRMHTHPGVSGYDFFHYYLVEKVIPVFEAAKEAGVKKAVLLNSYFAYFDRVWPEKHLADNHPYIKVRCEQADALINVGGGTENGGMDVVVLELPYIFGNMPEREPLWKEVFLDRFAKMPAVMFPKGGTNMIHVQGIAEAVVSAAFYGQHGDKLPIGAYDRKYKDMINMMMEDVGATKRYMGVPTWMATIGGYMVANDLKKTNQDSGLNYKRLMKDIQSQDLYFGQDVIDKVRKHLHYDEFGFNGGGSLEDGIKKTMIACYPHRFDEKGNLKKEWIGVNPIKKETATNNVFVNKKK